jgi:hypothetical protein
MTKRTIKANKDALSAARKKVNEALAEAVARSAAKTDLYIKLLLECSEDSFDLEVVDASGAAVGTYRCWPIGKDGLTEIERKLKPKPAKGKA